MLRPTGLPKSQFWRQQISLQNIARSRQRALRGVPRRLLAASARSRDPRTRGWRGGAISSTRRAGEPRLAAGGARGGGARRPLIPRPRPTPRTKWALSRPPSPHPRETAAQLPEGEGRGGERQGPAGPQPGASQRADSGHSAPLSASRAIAGRGSRSRARGSAGPTRAARRGQAEVTERRAPAARSQPRSGCGMGDGAAGLGEGCSAAVRSRSRCPG